MTPPLHAVDGGEPVFRIARQPDPWEWPDWIRAHADGTFGNRYDDPDGEYRVLYASSDRIATFYECLSRFRPDPAVLAAGITDNDDDAPETSTPGLVPADWCEKRRMGIARLEGRFCDIGHSDTLLHLRAALAARVLHYGLDDLDAGDIRKRAPRRFTQEISRYVFTTASDDDGQPFAGIRYASRLGDELTNWAIFEPNDPTDCHDEEIAADDPDLLAVVEAYGLTIEAQT